MSSEEVDLGSCCACEAPGARNILMLPFRAPVAGTGWGCILCGLPSDGAVAIVCDTCLENNKPLHLVVYGYSTKKQRAPIEGLEPFDHNKDVDHG